MQLLPLCLRPCSPDLFMRRSGEGEFGQSESARGGRGDAGPEVEEVKMGSWWWWRSCWLCVAGTWGHLVGNDSGSTRRRQGAVADGDGARVAVCAWGDGGGGRHASAGVPVPDI